MVIDPGHGGEDSGAVGARGLLEKDVTLDIGLRLKRLFSGVMPNVEVVLTRHSDRFVGLEERVAIANKKTADVFVSLHINSSESKDASGFEIYSLDVASDRHSERLAARENKVPGQKNKGVNFILADLRAFSNRDDSDKLASLVSRGLNSQLTKKIPSSHLNNRGYNQAIFHVLFVKMPAVLTELFFISNPKEERMLSTKETRELIARGILLGVKKFLESKVMRAEHASKR